MPGRGPRRPGAAAGRASGTLCGNKGFQQPEDKRNNESFTMNKKLAL